jgi:hypothetical protein
MAEEISIARLRAEQAARRAGIMARIQSLMIFLLVVWISEDYNHNQYFQAWASQHLGGLGFLLNGTLAAFYAGVLIAVYLNRPLPSSRTEKARRREQVRASPEAR